MSGYDDYRGEMQGTAISDQEIERFFAGEVSNGLATLSPLVEMLRDFDSPPSDAAVDRFAAKASRLALGSTTAQPTIPVHRRRALRLRPQLAGAALAVVVVIGGAGAAAAADGSAPGDALYGLDRALERIGIWDGRIEERLDEANSLFVEGQTRLALEHATEALAEDGESSELALTSLEDALDELPGPEDPEVATTEKVGALLTYLQENVGKGVGADGREFGQGVAELARGLTGEGEESAPATTPPLPTAPDNDSSRGNDDGPGNGNGNAATSPGQGNQGTNPGQGNGNQGTNPGQGHGNPGTNPGQGNGSGDQGTNPGQGSGDETGEPPEDGDPDPPGQGNGSENQGTNPGQLDESGDQGNGPPPGSPSETAPGRGNQP